MIVHGSLLIFSSHSNTSPHFVRELTKAVSKGVIIIPFRIEDAPLSKSMEYLIGFPHWLDALTPPLEQHIDTLVRRVKPSWMFLSETIFQKNSEILKETTRPLS